MINQLIDILLIIITSLNIFFTDNISGSACLNGVNKLNKQINLIEYCSYDFNTGFNVNDDVIVAVENENISDNISGVQSSIIEYKNLELKHKTIVLITISIIGIIISLCAMYLIIILNKRVKKTISKVKESSNHIIELNRTMSILFHDSSIEIMKYDIAENKIYLYKNGDYTLQKETLKDFENTLHPDDLNVYKNCISTLLSEEKESFFLNLRVFCKELNKYCYYEYKFASVKIMPKENITQLVLTRQEFTANVEQGIKAEKEISEAKEYGAELKTILDKLPVSISIKDPVTKTYSYFNNASYDWINCEDGCSSKDLFDSDTVDITEKNENRIIETGEVYTDNEVLTLVDGSVLDTFVKKIPIEFEGKKQILIASIDLTEAKKSEKKIKELQQQSEIILNNTNSGVIYIDKNYEIQWSNIDKVFKSINGNEYRVGKKCFEGYGLSSPCGHCNVMKSLYNNEVCVCQINNTGGQTLEIVTLPITYDNETTGILIKVDDRTEHYKIMEEMQLAKEKAIQSDVLKSAFLANMSHEIRTPLNAIVGFSELLISTTGENERIEFNNIINKNCDLLLSLIDDILDLSKIEAGMFEFHNAPVNLNKIILDTYATFSYKTENKNLKLSYVINEKNPDCIIDKKRFIQILNNFLSNAIKYTVEGEIVFGYEIQNNYNIKIFVKDTGIGISEENKKNVFKRFQKFDDFAQGTGLGLAICKALVSNCEGADIGFESELGKGSEFWVIIPSKIYYENA